MSCLPPLSGLSFSAFLSRFPELVTEPGHSEGLIPPGWTYSQRPFDMTCRSDGDQRPGELQRLVQGQITEELRLRLGSPNSQPEALSPSARGTQAFVGDSGLRNKQKV